MRIFFTLIFTCFFGERLNSRLSETGDTAEERNTPSFYFWAARSGGQAGNSQATSINARAAMQAVAGTWGVCDAQSRHRAQRIAARAAIAAAAAEVASNRAAEKAVAQREAAAMAEAAEANQRLNAAEEEAAASEAAAASLRAASTVQQQWQMAQRLQQNGAATTAQRQRQNGTAGVQHAHSRWIIVHKKSKNRVFKTVNVPAGKRKPIYSPLKISF